MKYRTLLLSIIFLITFIVVDSQFEPHIIFDEGTSEEYMQEISLEYRAKRYEFMFPSQEGWTKTAYNQTSITGVGNPTILTWGIVPDGTLVSESSGTHVSNLTVHLTNMFGSLATAKQTIQKAWNLWGSQTGLIFVEETKDDGAVVQFNGPHNYGVKGVRADIRMAGFYIDGNSKVLGYAYNPDWGDMVLDTGDTAWAGLTNGDYIRLYNLIAHEGGHALNIAHSCPINGQKLMEPILSTAYIGPKHDDLRAAHRWYGDKYEKNPTFATAYSLGNLTANHSFPLASLHDYSDVDYFSFNIGDKQRIIITITPNGTAYVTGPQASGDSGCSNSGAGTSINSNFVQNISFALYNSNQTLIKTVTNGWGSAGSLTQNLPSKSSRYYLKVFTSDTRSGANDLVKPVQMYGITISTSCIPCTSGVLNTSTCACSALRSDLHSRAPVRLGDSEIFPRVR